MEKAVFDGWDSFWARAVRRASSARVVSRSMALSVVECKQTLLEKGILLVMGVGIVLWF